MERQKEAVVITRNDKEVKDVIRFSDEFSLKHKESDELQITKQTIRTSEFMISRLSLFICNQN